MTTIVSSQQDVCTTVCTQLNWTGLFIQKPEGTFSIDSQQ